MAVFTSLPTDIIRIILHFIVNSESLDMIAKKMEVSLLGVCRDWCAIVVPGFYNRAYFQSYEHQDYNSEPPRTFFVVQTNLGLILQNGYGDSVRSFLYLPEEKDYAVDGLMRIAQILDISADNCPGLDSLMDYHGNNSNIPMDWDNVQHIAAITNIATSLASKLPNINHLNVYIQSAHGIEICFASALTDCFADKLVAFTYTGTSYFPIKRTMLGLQTVYLSLTGYDKGQNHITLCPRLIQKLTILTKGTLFDWRIFSTEQNSDSIVFDKLEYFDCRDYRRSRSVDSFNITHSLHFPSIKEVTVHDFALGMDVIERQLRSGLQKLVYLNAQPNLLELSRLDLSSLKSLKLNFGFNSSAAVDFVVKTNAFFNSLKGIPSVKVHSFGDVAALDSAKIHWPNLTRLNIELGIVKGNVFELALSMPDLVYLEISNCQFGAEIIGMALTYFKNLRSDHTKPSGSNVNTLKIGDIKHIHYDEFSSAIQVLRWFWPKLSTIEIHSEV